MAAAARAGLTPDAAGRGHGPFLEHFLWHSDAEIADALQRVAGEAPGGQPDSPAGGGP